MAEKAGIDRVTYGRQERGTQKPLCSTLQRISDALAVDVGDIDFPQWPEDYINNLEIPSKIKGSNENQFETEDGSLLNEDEIKAEVIEVTDPRIVNQMELTPKPMEEAQAEPEPESSPILEPVKTTLALVPKVESGKIIKQEGTVVGVRPSKTNSGGPIIWGLSRRTVIVILVVICVAIVVIAGYFIYKWYSRRAQQQMEAAKPRKLSSGDSVTGFLNNYGK